MGRGIASELIARAVDKCEDAGATALTVNSSLNAVGFYERMGFVPTDEPQRLHGFVYVPMEKRLQSAP
jgi:GNAT superfamily N-acetyltransferase